MHLLNQKVFSAYSAFAQHLKMHHSFFDLISKLEQQQYNAETLRLKAALEQKQKNIKAELEQKRQKKDPSLDVTGQRINHNDRSSERMTDMLNEKFFSRHWSGLEQKQQKTEAAKQAETTKKGLTGFAGVKVS